MVDRPLCGIFYAIGQNALYIFKRVCACYEVPAHDIYNVSYYGTDAPDFTDTEDPTNSDIDLLLSEQDNSIVGIVLHNAAQFGVFIEDFLKQEHLNMKFIPVFKCQQVQRVEAQDTDELVRKVLANFTGASDV